MLDDVTLTSSVDPLTFGQALTAPNVHSVSITSPPVPGYILRICYDDEVITEFATSCPLLVL